MLVCVLPIEPHFHTRPHDAIALASHILRPSPPPPWEVHVRVLVVFLCCCRAGWRVWLANGCLNVSPSSAIIIAARLA